MTSKPSPWPPRPHRTIDKLTETNDKDEAQNEMRQRIDAIQQELDDSETEAEPMSSDRPERGG